MRYLAQSCQEIGQLDSQGKFTWYVFPEVSTGVFKILPLEVVSQLKTKKL